MENSHVLSIACDRIYSVKIGKPLLSKLLNKDTYLLPVVYSILDKTTGKYYVGSTINLYKRLWWGGSAHFSKVRLGIHRFMKFELLSNFEFNIEEICEGKSVDYIRSIEKKYIDKYNSFTLGLNCNDKGNGNCNGSYGTYFINNKKVNRRIPVGTPIPNGWVKGRLMPATNPYSGRECIIEISKSLNEYFKDLFENNGKLKYFISNNEFTKITGIRDMSDSVVTILISHIKDKYNKELVIKPRPRIDLISKLDTKYKCILDNWESIISIEDTLENLYLLLEIPINASCRKLRIIRLLNTLIKYYYCRLIVIDNNGSKFDYNGKL